jgi:hypothetical protein
MCPDYGGSSFSISDGSPSGSGFSRVAVDLTLGDNDQQAAAHQLVNRRGASSGSQSGPQTMQARGTTLGGVDPTGRSRSLGGHQGLRAVRPAPVVEHFETFQNVGSATRGGIVFLEGRARTPEERLQHEAGSMVLTTPPGVTFLSPRVITLSLCDTVFIVAYSQWLHSKGFQFSGSQWRHGKRGCSSEGDRENQELQDAMCL